MIFSRQRIDTSIIQVFVNKTKIEKLKKNSNVDF